MRKDEQCPLPEGGRWTGSDRVQKRIRCEGRWRSIEGGLRIAGVPEDLGIQRGHLGGIDRGKRGKVSSGR